MLFHFVALRFDASKAESGAANYRVQLHLHSVWLLELNRDCDSRLPTPPNYPAAQAISAFVGVRDPSVRARPTSLGNWTSCRKQDLLRRDPVAQGSAWLDRPAVSILGRAELLALQRGCRFGFVSTSEDRNGRVQAARALLRKFGIDNGRQGRRRRSRLCALSQALQVVLSLHRDGTPRRNGTVWCAHVFRWGPARVLRPERGATVLLAN
jgi:hypothetical protein